VERRADPAAAGDPPPPGQWRSALGLLAWGLVPPFTNELKAARKPINARADTVATSGMFRGALAQRRCLVPADAFYEWRAMADGKQPYTIARRDRQPMAFAGLWEGWRAPGGSGDGRPWLPDSNARRLPARAGGGRRDASEAP